MSNEDSPTLKLAIIVPIKAKDPFPWIKKKAGSVLNLEVGKQDRFVEVEAPAPIHKNTFSQKGKWKGAKAPSPSQ